MKLSNDLSFGQISFDATSATTENPVSSTIEFGPLTGLHPPLAIVLHGDLNFILVDSDEDNNNNEQTMERRLTEFGTPCPSGTEIRRSPYTGLVIYSVTTASDYTIAGCDRSNNNLVVALLTLDYIEPNEEGGPSSPAAQALRTTSPPTTKSPTVSPTFAPTGPTHTPTNLPTAQPTMYPTHLPTLGPTTASPTSAPTKEPTASPTNNPTGTPTFHPTTSPTINPTESIQPTPAPTSSPSMAPFPSPTSNPQATTEASKEIIWERSATNIAIESFHGEVLGAAFSLSDDGTVMTVGAAFNSEQGEDAGRIIRYDTSNPSNVAEIYGSETAYLGFEVGASGDGNILAAYDSEQGDVLLYEYSEPAQDYNLVTSFGVEVNGASSDFALSRDGRWLVVVGELYDPDTKDTKMLVKLYSLDPSKGTATQHGPNILFGINTDTEWGYFDTDITANGSHIIVSHIGEDGVGMVRVYQRSSTTLVELGQPLIAADDEDDYGSDVKIMYDTSRNLMIGIGISASNKVVTYIFQTSKWVQLGNTLDGSKAFGDDSDFGYDLAFNSSGNRLVVGAPSYEKDSGAAQVYEFSGAEWVPLGPPIQGNPESSFGEKVKLDASGTILAVSAPEECAADGTCGGALYLFHAS